MKRILLFLFLISACVFLCGSSAQAQIPDDALRLSTPGLSIGARAVGMGAAYTSIANDFSGSYWNPAGLGQMRLNEATLALSHVSYGDNSMYHDNRQSYTNSSTSLNSFGLVYPFPTARGSLVLAIGYGRQADFTTGLSFRGLNPSGSIIQTWAADGQPIPDYITRAEYLALADTTPNGTITSPIHDSLTQSGKTLEGGGLNNVSISGAVEAARDFYLGLTLNFLTGSYSLNRTYREEDLQHVYETFPYDFSDLLLHQTIESDISGFSAKFGLLYKMGRSARLGLAIKTPSWITVRETYTDDAQSSFDNGQTVSDPPDGDPGTRNEFDVQTPYVFSAGLSMGGPNFLVAGDIEYTDWTQMEFRNVDAFLLGQNTQIKEDFQPTVNLRVGAECEVPPTDMRLRGGFMYLPSPHNGDVSSFAQKYVTAGAGFIVEGTFAIDLAYAYGFWDTDHRIYKGTKLAPGASTDTEQVHTHNLFVTASYRF